MNGEENMVQEGDLHVYLNLIRYNGEVGDWSFM